MARLLSLIVALALGTGASGMFDAASWVRAHSQAGQPDMSDLKELQTENPEAYALVKALLVKNSLGLIKKKATDDTQVEDSGDDSAAAPTETHTKPRSMWGWKPADDSAEVQNIMGQVAGSLSAMKSKPGKTSLAPEQVDNPGPGGLAAVDWQEASPPPATSASAPVSSPLEKDMEDVDMSSSSPVDMSSWPARTDEAAPQKASSSTTPSTGSNDDDDIFSKGAKEAKTAPEPKQPAAASGGNNGAFWSGLFGGVGGQQPAPKKAAPVVPKQKKSSLSAVGEGTGFLKNFNWNSDDDSDAKPAASSSENQFNLPAGNSYAHFLS